MNRSQLPDWKVTTMSGHPATVVFALLITLFLTPLKAHGESNAEKAGDIVQVLIPATAFIATLSLDDHEGTAAFLKSFAVNQGITSALKYAINKPRPEGNGDYSFPSGHTSAAFQGATFIAIRYGWRYGIPAYLGAAYVGWSRIEGESDKHDIYDVAAGAAIGILSSYYFTKPYKGVEIVPFAGSGALGFSMCKRW